MNDAEVMNIAWRAFYLGLRLAAHDRGELPPTLRQINERMRSLQDIARNLTTLHDPSEAAANSPVPEFSHGLASRSIHSDRDIAQLIEAGLMAALDTTE